MRLRPFVRAVALCVCASLGSQFSVVPAAAQSGAVRPNAPIRIPQHPPIPIKIVEPPRPKSTLPPFAATRPQIVAGVRPGPGRAVQGPPMLKPMELDAVIATSARRRSVAQATKAAVPRPGDRGTRSLPSNPSASGTGITPWWRYRAEAMPGGGRAMVNVGTGNFVVQSDDVAVPHKGVPMAFTRTYNSQNGAAIVSGSSVTWQSLFGNGWTNTFDAHLLATSPTRISVYDVDGARYDYAGNGSAYTSLTPGQHAVLASDNSCGMTWTKKSGVIYYFWAPTLTSTCSSGAAYLGYAGRLYQIIGRNRNTYLTLNYTWDNGDASATGKINAISVQAESGLTTSLHFADVNGRRLLTWIVLPDGATQITYGYDNNGNLTAVTYPPNGTGGPSRNRWYSYSAAGSDWVMSGTAPPRWTSCLPSCSADGGFIAFTIGGSSAATSTVSQIVHAGVMNFAPNDGSNTLLQNGVQTTAMGYLVEWYTTGVTTPTYRDSDGHYVNWVVDGSGRPTQTQTCAATLNQGQQCVGTLLTTNETWDTDNNETSFVDPRGRETDMAYDAQGNVVAIGQAPQYFGYDRPTTLIDYDPYGNVKAVCDPALVHTVPANDWSGQYSGGSDSYCSSLYGNANHPSIQYDYSRSWELYGEVSSLTTASGYVYQVGYDLGPQGGTDFGLPTSVTGASITQLDGTTRLPSNSVVYDGNGNVVCSRADAGSGAAAQPAVTVMAYDAMGRLTATADADDASLAGACTGKTPGIAGSSIVTRRTYYADGSLATTQTPSEAAANGGTVYGYDLDGNPTSEAPYSGSPQSPQTARMRRWYDGGDRLVETQEPADPATQGDIPIGLRYRYDLSANGTIGAPTTVNGTVVTAHGNMFDTVKNTPTGWIDFTYSAFDAIDRVTTQYAFAPCPAQLGSPTPAGPIYCSQPAFATRYDWDSSSLNPNFSGNGLLVATLDAMNVTRMFGYDALGAQDSVQYNGDNGVTPQVSYAHDFDGRLTDFWNSFSVSSAPAQNHVAYTYTSGGALQQENNTSLNTTISYSYYPDGMQAGLSATTSQTVNGTTSYVVNQPNLYQYAYRNDGALTYERFGAASQAVSWTYTRGGRSTAQTDFSSAPSLSAQYNDGYGRLSSYTTPSGTYGSFHYDAQGRLTSYTDPYAGVDGETVTSTYNVRGDLVARDYSGGNPASKPGFHYKNIQGVLVQNPSVDQFDGRTGALLYTVNDVQYLYDQVGRLSFLGGSLAYDAESRLISGDTFAAASAPDSDCHSGGAVAPWVPPARELRYYYDGVGRLFQDTNPAIVISAQTIPQIRQWFWNGSTPLYTIMMNSDSTMRQLAAYTADRHGSIDPGSSALTLSDNDMDGSIAQYHNSTGHSTWAGANIYNQFCQHSTPLPASPNYVGPASGAVPDDGTSSASIVVESSGRAYLSSSMGYATPDYESATPYQGNSDAAEAARRPLFTQHCQAGMVFDAKQGKCVPAYDGIPGSAGNPFGFRFPRLQIPCFIPAHAVSIGGELPMIVITPVPPIVINGGAHLTVTNKGTVFLSPSASLGTPKGFTVAALYHLPGQKVDDIADKFSLGFLVQNAPPATGVTLSGNNSGILAGPTMGLPSMGGTTSWGIKMVENNGNLRALFCPV